MEKKILTAMLSFAFLFFVTVSISAQATLTDNFNAHDVASKVDAAYLSNLPNFVPADQAKFLLKTQVKANEAAYFANEGASTASGLLTENTLYKEVYRQIYREQLSVEDAIVTAYATMLTTQTPPDVSGVSTQYANSALLQNLVNLLSL